MGRTGWHAERYGSMDLAVIDELLGQTTNLTVKEKESPRIRSPFRWDVLKVLRLAKRKYIVRKSVVARREESIVFKIIGCPGSKYQFSRENDHSGTASP